jgi:acetyl esterase
VSHDELQASLIERGFDPDAAARAAARYDPSKKPFHESTVEEVRAGDNMTGAGVSGPDVHRVEDRTIDGPFGSIPIRVYSPHEGPGAPLMVFLHGGGWMLGDLDSSDGVCRHLASEAAMIVVSIDYRKAPEHRFPVAIEECYAATEWVGAHAAELGGDPNLLAVGGDSAGGTMAAAVCVMARDRGGPPLCFQLLINPSTDYDLETPSMLENSFPPMSGPADIKWFLDRYLTSAADELDPRAMPAAASSHANLPRAFMLTAQFDILRDSGENYARLLTAAGVPARLKRYPGVAHGWFNLTAQLKRSREAMDDAVAELAQAFASRRSSEAATPRP